MLIINGEENGDQSLMVPITSSIRGGKKISMMGGKKMSDKMMNGKTNVVGNVKKITKFGSSSSSSKHKTSNGGGEGRDTNNNDEDKNKDNVQMTKIKGDTYSFGLENDAMLRVLVNVTNPNDTKKSAKSNNTNEEQEIQEEEE